MALTTDEQGCAEQLARFFPNLPCVRIPMRVAPLRAGISPARLHEAVVAEYGSEKNTILLRTLPRQLPDLGRSSGKAGEDSDRSTVVTRHDHERWRPVWVS